MTMGTKTGTDLTELEQEILEFERHWWKHVGAKRQRSASSSTLSSTSIDLKRS